jgi:hypothetical protein
MNSTFGFPKRSAYMRDLSAKGARAAPHLRALRAALSAAHVLNAPIARVWRADKAFRQWQLVGMVRHLLTSDEFAGVENWYKVK